MKVSIIIPVYNAEQYLQECVESAMNQTYKNIEIIAVDDGSADHSLEILKKYADRIKIIEKENGGAASALNVGIKHATGEWIKKIDADDILHEDAVEILVETAKSFGDRAKSYIFYTNYDVIDSTGKKLYEFIEPDFNNLSNFERGVILLDHCIGHHITSLIHKSIFEKFGYFNEQIKYVEDYEFWLRCQLLYDIRFFRIPKTTAKYRIHKAQLTQAKRKEMAANSELLRSKILEQLDAEVRNKYLKALAEFQKNKYPVLINLFRQSRDVLLRALPDPLSSKILDTCMKSKIVSRIYQQVLSSWNKKEQKK